jgi:hypothetical protein
MKLISIVVLLVLSSAVFGEEVWRCVDGKKVIYQQTECGALPGVKRVISHEENVVPAVRDVEVAPLPVPAYYGVIAKPTPGVDPVERIQTYAGPRYYHDHGPPPYGGTGRFAPERRGVHYRGGR